MTSEPGDVQSSSREKTFGKNAPDKQRRNKTMASEVAAIFCSGAKALSCCVNGSHQKMFHSETRFRRYVSGREAPCLAGGCATAFLPILFKEGRNIKSPWYFWVKFDYHEGPAPPPP